MSAVPRALVDRLLEHGWEAETVSVLADWCEEHGFFGWAHRLRTPPTELGLRWITEVLAPLNFAIHPPLLLEIQLLPTVPGAGEEPSR